MKKNAAVILSLEQDRSCFEISPSIALQNLSASVPSLFIMS